MIIDKNIPMGSIQVDTQNKKIWLNCPNCLIRIQNITFKNVEDKFAMLDIDGNNVTMIPGSFGVTDSYNDFVRKLNLFIYPLLTSLSEKQEEFLETLLNHINAYIKEKNYGDS